jgi:glycosyltransferase involved in cell wall biosynthesis
MRVVFIHPFTQHFSGPDESLLALLEPLLEGGMEAHLVVPHLGPLAERYRRLGVTVHLQPLTILHRGMKLTETTLFAPRLLARAARLAALLRRLGADAVHTNMEVVLEGGLAAQMVGIPHIQHYRGNSLDSPPRLFDLLTLVWTTFSDRIYCVSNATAEIFRRRGHGAKVEVLYNPIHVAPFRAAVRSDSVRSSLGATTKEPLVITIGRLNARKDVDTFVRACERIAATIPEARFAVVGGAESPSELEYRAQIHELVEHSKLRNRLIFAGPRTDVPEIMKAADLFVLASRHEGFGRVVAEAMAAGTAVVASREGGLPELIEEPRYGLGAIPGDPADFSRQILTLLRDEPRRRRMGEAAAERAMGFDAWRTARRVRCCYDELFARRRRSQYTKTTRVC